MSATTMKVPTPAQFKMPTCQSQLNWRCSVSQTHIYTATHSHRSVFHVISTSCSLTGLNFSISSLSLLDRTVILTPPKDLKVQPGTKAIFTCVGLYDTNLRLPQIQWRKNNQKLMESFSDEK